MTLALAQVTRIKEWEFVDMLYMYSQALHAENGPPEFRMQ